MPFGPSGNINKTKRRRKRQKEARFNGNEKWEGKWGSGER
jgi:hypothetical protein